MYTPSGEKGIAYIDRVAVHRDHPATRPSTVEPFIKKQRSVTLGPRQLPHRMDNCT
jgi:hypothetical protein